MSNDPFNPELFRRLSRRQVFKAAAVGGAALASLPLLAACGDSGDDGTATTTGSGSGTTGSADINKIKGYVGPIDE